jgi:hypothetical protein
VWCVGYIATTEIHAYLLAPLLWSLAWTLLNRMEDFTADPAPAARSVLLFLPSLVSLLGALHENSLSSSLSPL